MRTARSVSLLLLACGLSIPCLAEVPLVMNYQGRLLSGTNLINGTVGLSLCIYDSPAGGSKLYEDSNSVIVADGLYNTLIGDNTVTGTLAAAVATASPYVEVVVNGTVLTPRERIASSAYSLATRGWRMTTDGGVEANSGINDLEPGAAYSTIAGGQVNDIGENVTHTFLGGGRLNLIQSGATNSFLGGGDRNRILAQSDHAVLGGGMRNDIGYNSSYAVLGGGKSNQIDAANLAAFLGGGYENRIGATSLYCVVSGGNKNTTGPNNWGVSIAGGDLNSIGEFAWGAVIGGGSQNTIGSDATYATIPGGQNNEIANSAADSFAAGHGARAAHYGTFVWSDDFDQLSTFSSTAPCQFLIRAHGGVGVNTGSPHAAIEVASDTANERLRFSGREYFQGVNTSVNGPTFLLGVNRTSNRQLWLADSANLASSTTNALLRLLILGTMAQIDSVATDGITPRDLGVGVGLTAKANGNIGIGTTSPNYTLEVNGTAHRTDNSSAWTQTSDRRLKTDIESIHDALAEIDRVRPVSFRYTAENLARNPGLPSTVQFGVIAQEFQQVFPDSVGTNSEGYLTINAGPLTYFNTAAIQDLKRELDATVAAKDAELEKLAAQNADLKAQMEAMKARLDALERR